jgi:hypothetical protein
MNEWYEYPPLEIITREYSGDYAAKCQLRDISPCGDVGT